MLKYRKIILKNDQGKYVKVKRTRQRLILCIEDVQNSQVHSLALWVFKEEKQEHNTLAFLWNYEDIFCSPKVNGDKLELEELNSSDVTKCLSSSHWFEMRNHQRGDNYGLGPVDKPEHQLSLSSNIKLQISDDDTKWIEFADENVEQGSGELSQQIIAHFSTGVMA